MGAPQIIVIVLSATGLLLQAYNHGKPREGKNNFFVGLISAALTFGLLIWGGFFN